MQAHAERALPGAQPAEAAEGFQHHLSLQPHGRQGSKERGLSSSSKMAVHACGQTAWFTSQQPGTCACAPQFCCFR